MDDPEASVPFKGLEPYDEKDARFFFGREKEQRIIVANLHAYALTVLYGATGVGKSSVLRAGVAHQLILQARENVARRGRPELAVAVVDKWREDPIAEIRRGVERMLAATWPEGLEGTNPEDLGEALGLWAERIQGPILIILDQFEEYFLYQTQSNGSDTFAQEFPKIVNSTEILANFIVAIREDAMAWLDEFKVRVPALFDNYLRIKHLDRTSARRAINGPIDIYNESRPPSDHVVVEKALIDAVLEQVQTGRVALGARGQGLTGREPTSQVLHGSIETPFLQLVMRRVWDAEQANNSLELRLATLRDELGGASHIVQTYLGESVGKLSAPEQEVAADMFRYLVTQAGTKFAQLLPDLTGFTDTPEAVLKPVLDQLARARILREVRVPRGQGTISAYEIFHDVLAQAILDWRTEYLEEQKRARLEVRLIQKQEEADRKEQQRRLALSNALAYSAKAELGVDPELSVLLAVEAVRSYPTPPAQDALRQSLLDCHIRSVLHGHGGDVGCAAFSPDGELIVTASQDTSARLWRAATGEQLALLLGHSDWVWSAEFSPDGTRILTASQDGTARLWETATREQLAVLDRHTGAVRAARFDAHGTRIVTASDDGTARLWDGSTGVPLHVLTGHGSTVRDAVFTPDGRRVVTGGFDATSRVWDTDTGAELATLDGHEDLIWGVSVSPDGHLAATASRDGTARIWDLDAESLAATLVGHTHEVWSAQFSPDSKRVVTASFDGTARIWEVANEAPAIQLRAHTHSVYGACFSSNGHWVLTCSLDGTAIVHDVHTGRVITRLRGHTRGVSSARFSPDDKRVVTTSQDATARYWDADSGRTSVELTGHVRAVINVAFSPDSTRLVTASGDDSARVWDLTTGKPVLHLTGHRREVSSAVFSADGSRIATGSWDATAAIRDARSGEILIMLDGHKREVTSVTFNPDGTRLVTGSRDQTARVWDVATGERLLRLTSHKAAIRSVAYSPDGQFIATASNDTTARLWDAHTGDLLKVLADHREPVWSVGFSHDSRLVITASEDRTARIWDLASATVVKVLRGHTGRVHGAAFSANAEQVITAGEDRTAVVWSAATGRPQAELRGHAGAVNAAAFSADNNLAVTGGDDGVAIVYQRIPRPTVDELLQQAQERVTRELTLEERVKYIREEPEEADVEPPEEIISR